MRVELIPIFLVLHSARVVWAAYLTLVVSVDLQASDSTNVQNYQPGISGANIWIDRLTLPEKFVAHRYTNDIGLFIEDILESGVQYRVKVNHPEYDGNPEIIFTAVPGTNTYDDIQLQIRSDKDPVPYVLDPYEPPTKPYECTTDEPLSVLLEGAHHSVVIESESYPSFPPASADSESSCQWRVTAPHGAKVMVTAMDVEMAGSCTSTSILSLSDDSFIENILRYPGAEARCNKESTIPSSKSSLIAEGELVITSTPGVRYRLLLEATIPEECPAFESHEYCPEGPCCGEDDCVCQYVLGHEPLEIQPSKPGLCSYRLLSAAGSQVSVNFLEMALPSTDPHQGCESWVSLEETGTHLSSVIASQKYCGKNLPNYPGPSVFTAGANSLFVHYNIDEESLNHAQGFKIAAAAVNPLCGGSDWIHQGYLTSLLPFLYTVIKGLLYLWSNH